MGNEAYWNTFAHTGKITDYLRYVEDDRHSDDVSQEKQKKEERGWREGTSEWHGTVSGHHW